MVHPGNSRQGFIQDFPLGGGETGGGRQGGGGQFVHLININIS